MSDYGGLFDPDVPMHHQIYMQLRHEIIDGLWSGREYFPGEEELANRFAVSIITSRRALTRLAEDGFIKRERGRRPSVNPQVPGLDTPSIVPTMFPVGAHPFQYTLLVHGDATVPAEACQAFGVPRGSELWTCSRLRSFKGRPHSVAQNVQPSDIGNTYTTEELNTSPMFPLIERATGVKLVHLRRRLGISMPSAIAARNLGISLQDRTLVYTYILSDAHDNVAEWVRIYIHPNEVLPFEMMNLETREWETLEVV